MTWVPLGIAETLEEGLGGLITFPITLSPAGPLLLTFSHDCAVEFSRGYKTRNDATANARVMECVLYMLVLTLSQF